MAPATCPWGSVPGWLNRAGTRMLFSYMLRGLVPLPLPQKPCCPQEKPLSETKTTSVRSRSPRSSSQSSRRPICRSIAVTAAK